MRLVWIAVVLGTWITIGCKSTSENKEVSEIPAIKGSISHQHFGECDTVSNSGAAVDVDLWLPTDSSAASAKILNAINTKSIQRINSHADSSSVAENPAALRSLSGAFDVFQRNYKLFKRDVPSAPGCWQVDLKGDTVMKSAKILFYQLEHFAFTGGAHPNTFRAFYAFDLKTGEEKDMRSFIADSVALKTVVEKYFRKTEKLAPEADLEEAGYFLLNHQFAIPVSYVFTSTGILFYYNPYEIAPYARGVIKFTIPYDELEGIIKKEEVF